MKWRILILALPALTAAAAFGQSVDSTISVKQFPGTTVGAKVANAQSACTVQAPVKCYLLLEPSLAAYDTGTIPSLCSNCVLVDYRSGWPGGVPGITQLTNDVLAGPGSGSQSATLKTANTAPGSCGDASDVCVIVTDSKGRVTSQTAVPITGGGGGGGGSSNLTVTQAVNLAGSRCFSNVTQPDTTPPTSPCIFQNTSTTAMFVVVSGDVGGGGFHGDVYSDASATPTTLIGEFGRVNAGSSSPNFYPASTGFFVPAGNYYGISVTDGAGSPTIKSWTEYSVTGGGSMTWPAGGAGVPNYGGSSTWGTSYSSSNKIPANFVTTGTSGANIPLLSTANTWTLTQTFPSMSITNFELVNSSMTMSGQNCTLGSSCNVEYAPANEVAISGGVGQQLFGTGFAYTAYPAADIAAGALANGMTATTQSPGDSSVDLANDAFVAAGLATKAASNAATTVNSQTCTLGSTCTVTAAPSGSASGDLSGSYPGPTVAKVNGAIVPTTKTVVGTDSSGHIIDASAATLSNNTTGTASNLSGTPTLPTGTGAATGTLAAGGTNLASQAYVENALTSGSNSKTMTGAGTVTSTSFVTFTTNTLVLPVVPANTTRRGTCALSFQGSTSAVTPSFGINTSATLTGLYVMGVHYYFSTSAIANALPIAPVTTATTTALVNNLVLAAGTTSYELTFEFTVSANANAQTITIFGKTNSGTVTVDAGSGCSWN